MDTQLPKLKQSPWRQLVPIVPICLSIFLAAIVCWYQLRQPDPYITNVLTKTGDPTLGHAIFQINCSGCHGLAATGRIGPSLLEISKRKSPQGLIEQVIGGNTPPMPQFQPNPQEMADLLSYLETL